MRRAARATYECWQGCADVEGLVYLMEELGKIFGVVLVSHFVCSFDLLIKLLKGQIFVGCLL